MIRAIIVAALLSFATPALAVQTCTLKLPECQEIISSEFSTGGGKTGIWTMEVTCRIKSEDLSGETFAYRTFLASYSPAAAMFGFGRLAQPWHIDIKLDNSLKHANLICE